MKEPILKKLINDLIRKYTQRLLVIKDIDNDYDDSLIREIIKDLDEIKSTCINRNRF